MVEKQPTLSHIEVVYGEGTELYAIMPHGDWWQIVKGIRGAKGGFIPQQYLHSPSDENPVWGEAVAATSFGSLAIAYEQLELARKCFHHKLVQDEIKRLTALINAPAPVETKALKAA